MAQPRSTASFPALENKHRLRQAGAERFTPALTHCPREHCRQLQGAGEL